MSLPISKLKNLFLAALLIPLIAYGVNTKRDPNDWKFTSVTGSSSISTGVIVVSGGVGIAENLNVGGSVSATSFSVSNIGLGNGSVTAPSLFWTSDSDGTGTGLYRPAADVIGFAVNGIETGRVNSSGFTVGASGGTIGNSGINLLLNASNDGNVRIGTSTLIDAGTRLEEVTILKTVSVFAGPGINEIGLSVKTNITDLSATSKTLMGFGARVLRQNSGALSESANVIGGIFERQLANSSSAYTTTGFYASVDISPLNILVNTSPSGVSIAEDDGIKFESDTRVMSLGRKNFIRFGSLTNGGGGGSTAYISDNVAYSGNFFIHQSSTDVSVFGGALTFPSASLSGTAGAGKITYLTQSAAPSTPASGFSLYGDATNRFSWKGANGFLTKLDTVGNTADRVYTFPDAAGTIMLRPSDVSIAGNVTLTDNSVNFVSTAAARSLALPDPASRKSVV